VEVLADTRTEIAAVRLSATEQTKTHLYSSVQASQREPSWLMSFARRRFWGSLCFWKDDKSGKDYLLPDLAQIPVL
jgi:hypothetical protein